MQNIWQPVAATLCCPLARPLTPCSLSITGSLENSTEKEVRGREREETAAAVTENCCCQPPAATFRLLVLVLLLLLFAKACFVSIFHTLPVSSRCLSLSSLPLLVHKQTQNFTLPVPVVFCFPFCCCCCVSVRSIWLKCCLLLLLSFELLLQFTVIFYFFHFFLHLLC